jgi:hypothetical protein
MNWNGLVFLFAQALSLEPPAAPLIRGLDHMPVAVTDLDRSASDFENLGFAIKPGRLHTDGIRNKHVKFPNGGGIELITAVQPTDALAVDYVDWLKQGDGPAFWSVFSPDLASLERALTTLKLEATNEGDLISLSQTAFPHRLFFADRLRSPTDGPQYWAHPNTAYKLKAVWLAGAEGEKHLLSTLGAKPDVQPRCAPFDAAAQALIIPDEGDEVVFSSKLDRQPSREILGATVMVKRLDVARSVLDAHKTPYIFMPRCGPRSLWIGPAQAHGLWLELREG